MVVLQPEYIFRDISSIEVKNQFRSSFLDTRIFREGIYEANRLIDQIAEFEVNIFEILGMRNLSAFMGEIFARSIAKTSSGLFVSNPHQDGYPDLLLLDDVGRLEYERVAGRMQEKLPFSPFRTGGIEIKATCGAVPSPTVLARKGLRKPDIGDQRVELLSGYDWKAHHRETNNLLGILWDFIQGVPVIVAVFYSSDLEEEDWGKIVQPREGGGRTTSVSIMTKVGIRKMYDGWLCAIDDDRYLHYLDRKNQGEEFARASSF